VRGEPEVAGLGYDDGLTMEIEDDVSLAPQTTLGLGGPARHLIVARDEETVVEAVAWAKASGRGLELTVLGGGSNLVVADAGFEGVVLRVELRGVRVDEQTPLADGRVRVAAAAGEPWDGLVDLAVERGLGGIECLAGIPGLVGATPIQNVGAYGQEVSDTIVEVRVLDRATGEIVGLSNHACEFGYRDSVFKRRPAAFVVLGVTFGLTPAAGGAGGDGRAAPPRYRELAAYLREGARRDAASASDRDPTLAEVSRAVRALRRAKSMVLDPADPNRRSVGSFFTNPVVDTAAVAAVVGRALAAGLVTTAAEVPQFPTTRPERVKLSAGWLIEKAGFTKGFRRGPVGLSSNHALALVHHGGGTTAELLTLAREIRDAVSAIWGITLAPEPTLLGTTLDG